MLTYTRAHRLSRLYQELVAAGVTVEGLVTLANPDGTLTDTFQVFVLAGTNTATVDAVVAAHNPALLSTAEQQEADDTDALAAFIADYGDMLARLDTIQTEMTAIKGRADTLAGLPTWEGRTLAFTLTRLQSVMPALGADLSTVATEFRAVAIGLENMLRALRVVHRRQNG